LISATNFKVTSFLAGADFSGMEPLDTSRLELRCWSRVPVFESLLAADALLLLLLCIVLLVALLPPISSSMSV